jgi:hypothetical protein
MNHTRTAQRTDRRTFLEAGTRMLFASALAPRALEAGLADLPSGFGRAKRCILVYLLGGPPHLDMWDMKPHAPVEFRGPFRSITTSVPGTQVCEHLPRLAAQMQRLTIVRSVTYPNSDHPFMIYYTLTGRISPRALGANTVLAPSREDDPHLGSVVSRFVHTRRSVPGYVAIPEVQIRMKQIPVAGGGRAGFLGAEWDPLAVNEDPRDATCVTPLNLPDGVSRGRYQDRQHLLAVLDGRGLTTPETVPYAAVRRSASQLAESYHGEGMFSLDREPATLRDRYGRHRFGQSLLLARRLIERQVSFVGVHFNHMSQCDGWDTHSDNFPSLQKELLPLLDQGLAALLDDLADRGLLDETLVVCLGEFGRTPRVNKQGGRDHWGQCGSVVMAGGGVRGGAVVGASDKTGALPTDCPVGPPDIIATIYHALGLKPQSEVFDSRLGRRVALVDGQAIQQIF